MTTAYIFNPFTGNFDAVTTGLTPGDITGGTPNTFAGFDSTGALETVPGFNIDTNTGGMNELITLTPANAAALYRFINFENTVIPTADLTTLDFQNVQTSLNLVGPFNFNNTTGFRNSVSTSEAGVNGNINGLDNTVFLGDGTNVSSISGVNAFNTSIQQAANHTANNLIGINSSAQINGTTFGVNAFVSFIDIMATGQVTGFYNGIVAQNTFHTGAQMAGANAFADYTHIETGTTLTGNFIGFTVNTDIDAGSAVNGYTGVSISPTIEGDVTGNQMAALNIFPTFNGPAQTFAGINGNIQLGAAAVASGSIELINLSAHMQAGSSAPYIHSMGSFSNIDAGATLGSFEGININPTIDAVVPNIQLANFDVGGAGSATNLTGLRIDVSGFTTTNQPAGANITGAVQTNSQLPTSAPWVGIATGGNNIGGALVIEAGHPLSAGEFIFGNNLAFQLLASDDMGVDVTGGLIGYSNVGFVSLISVAATKTVDTVNLALAGAGLPAVVGDGGTITNMHLYRGIGVLPQGGNLLITNMYGLRLDGALSAASPTNLWGVSVEDANAENYFQKSLAIDTATKKVSSAGIGLEVSNGKAILAEGDIKSETSLTLQDPAGTDSITIQAPTLAAPYTVALPVDNGTVGQVLRTDGAGQTSWVTVGSGGAGGIPTYTLIQGAGTSGTYTVPVGAVALRVRMAGSGGSGAGGGTGASNGVDGGDTTFAITGGAIFLTASGGAGGLFGAQRGGSAGGATIASPAYGSFGFGNSGAGPVMRVLVNSSGGITSTGDTYLTGGQGGGHPLFGGAPSSDLNATSPFFATLSGAGGSGGGCAPAGAFSGAGGGSGGWVDVYIPAPLDPTYDWAVGSNGAGGAAGSSGAAGSGGADGRIEVYEYY